jgi:hypothetical protein
MNIITYKNMARSKKSEIIVEREKVIEHLETKPLTKSDIKEIEKETKPKREMTEKQKVHIQNLVQKNRERFQRVAEENKQKKEQIKQEKEEIIKQKLESGELVKITVPPKRKYTKKEQAHGEYHAYAKEEETSDDETEEETEEEPEYVPPPKPKKQRAPRRKKPIVESDSSDYSDTSEDEIKPKKIQKMKKTLEKIDETLSKANQPVNPYVALLNRRFNK